MTSARAIALSGLLLGAAGCCQKKDHAGPGAPSASAAVAEGDATLPPGALARFFPPDGAAGFKRSVAAETRAYSEMQFVRGKEKLSLTLTDAREDPALRARFQSPAGTLDGHPYLSLGGVKSALLVRDRFQLTVHSATASEDERKAWLRRFDLASLP
jgi:hypothetical protein